MSELSNNAELQHQIDDLQSRIAYQEEWLHALSDMAARQNTTIDQLQQQLQQYQSRLEAAVFSMERSEEPKITEKPPHY